MSTKGNFNPKTSYPRVAGDLVNKETVTAAVDFDGYGRGTLVMSADTDVAITGLQANKTYALLVYNRGGNTLTFTDSFVHDADDIVDYNVAGVYLLSLYCFDDTSGSEKVIVTSVSLSVFAVTTTTTTGA